MALERKHVGDGYQNGSRAVVRWGAIRFHPQKGPVYLRCLTLEYHHGRLEVRCSGANLCKCLSTVRFASIPEVKENCNEGTRTTSGRCLYPPLHSAPESLRTPLLILLASESVHVWTLRE